MHASHGTEALISCFGFLDRKGKGATDMWRAGVPVEEIRYDMVTRTAAAEIYVKQRWQETAQPNQVTMAS